MSMLLKRLWLAATAGMQFGGRRDVYDVLGYNKAPSYEDFESRYQRQDIATRIINAPVEATWSDGIRVYDKAGADGPFSLAFKQANLKYNILQYLARADRLCGIGHYSVLIFGLSGTNSFETPVSGKSNLLYLQAYGEGAAQVANYVTSPSNPRFGKPDIYTVTPVNKVITGANLSAFRVHNSRTLHICNSKLEGDVIGTPVLENVLNLLDDLLKVVGGSAEAFWLVANRGMQADVDKEMDLRTEDAEALSEEIEEYQHNLRRFIRTRGVKINNLGSESPDPKNSFEAIIGLISGATGIPRRILLGSELGQLASEQDRSNWSERVTERRTQYAEPNIFRPFLMRCIELGVLPEPKGDLVIDWPEALRQTPMERAQTAAYFGRALANLSTGKQDVITREEVRTMLNFAPDNKGEDTSGVSSNPDSRPSAEPAKRVRRVAEA